MGWIFFKIAFLEGMYSKWKWVVEFSKICNWGPPTIQCQGMFMVASMWNESCVKTNLNVMLCMPFL